MQIKSVFKEINKSVLFAIFFISSTLLLLTCQKLRNMATTNVSPNLQAYNLSEEQIQSYHDNGFLLIEDFFSNDEHKTLDNYCNEFQGWGKEKGKWMQYYELNTATGENQLCRTENFTPFHNGMKDYVNSPRLLQVMNKLHGEEYVLFKEKVNYKLPGGGGEHGEIYAVLR